MENTLYEYLNSLKIPVPKKYVEKLIQSHPDYPSLLSISDVLERFGIKAQIGALEKENLSDVDFPYLLHTEKKGGKFLLVNDAKSLKTHRADLDHWKGIILKAEPITNIADEESKRQYTQERYLKIVRGSLVFSLAILLLRPFRIVRLVLLFMHVIHHAMEMILEKTKSQK